MFSEVKHGSSKSGFDKTTVLHYESKRWTSLPETLQKPPIPWFPIPRFTLTLVPRLLTWDLFRLVGPCISNNDRGKSWKLVFFWENREEKVGNIILCIDFIKSILSKGQYLLNLPYFIPSKITMVGVPYYRSIVSELCKLLYLSNIDSIFFSFYFFFSFCVIRVARAQFCKVDISSWRRITDSPR